jgi:hypothetical protein
MVALELFTISSIFAAGSVIKYFLKKERYNRELHLNVGVNKGGQAVTADASEVEKFVELSVEETRNDPPIYIGTGASGAGVGIPVGGGNYNELKTILEVAIPKDRKDIYPYNWTFTDLGRTPCAPPTRYWLNTPDDLKNFFETHGIPQNIAPLRLPMQIREVTIPSSEKLLYSVPEAHVMGTNRNAVIRAAAARNTIHHRYFTPALVCAMVTGTWLYGTWNEYDAQQKRERIQKIFG